MKNYVITIARGFGSGGKEIAAILSEELQIPYYDKQILKMASDQTGISENLFVDVDEKLKGSHISKLLKGMPSQYIAEPSDKKFLSEDNLYHIQKKIIEELAKTESCIILGKCADRILAGYENAVSYFIDAPREYCICSVIEKLGVSEEEAESMVVRTNKYRTEYYKYYSGGRDWKDPLNYDLILNAGRLGKREAVRIIKNHIKSKLNVEAAKRD